MDDEARDTAGRAGALLGGASAVLILQLLGVALNFGLQIFLARSLGTASYGVYVYALRWLGLLALVCQGGLALGSLRFVPAYVANADWPHLAGFLRSGWRVVVLASAVVAAVAWGTVAGLGERLSQDMRRTLSVAFLALPLYGLMQVWSSALRGCGRVVLSQWPAPVLRPIVLGLAVALWLAASQPLTAPAAMALNLMTVGTLTALTGGWLRRALPVELKHAEPRNRYREWRRVMPPLMLQSLIGMAIQRLDVLMIGVFLGMREVALYAAASRVAGLIVFGRKAVNAWAAPEISRLHAAGKPVRLARLARLASRVTCGFSVAIAAVILLAGHQVLTAFGSDFTGAREALAILVAGHLSVSLIGPASFLLTLTGNERSVVRISTATLLPSAALQLLLIPSYGLAGAAVAAAIARLGYHLALMVAALRGTGARATIF